ncbi:MAG: hypothetical protein AB7U98_13780 [Candidatus Nitrosocosmicus sp.]
MSQDQATATAAPAKKAKAEPQIETVTMDDGRVVDFAGKKRLQKESWFDKADNTINIRLDFRNGETRIFKSQPLPEGVPAQVLKAAAHGYEQKLGDEISGVEKIDDAIYAVDELMDRLKDGGDWNAAKEGGEGLSGTSVLFRALVEVSGQSKEQVKVFLRQLTPKQKMALREDPALKPIVTRIEAERNKKEASGVDTASLLAGLQSGAALAAASAAVAGTGADAPV